MNGSHKSPPVPFPSHLKEDVTWSAEKSELEKIAFVSALFGNDSRLIRNNISFPYRFEGNRKEGLPHLTNCSCEDCRKKGDIESNEEKHDFEGEEQAKLVQMGEMFPNNDEMNKYFLKEAGGNVVEAINNIFSTQSSYL